MSSPPAPEKFPSEGRVLGVDLGSRRIGVAACDAGRRLSSPVTVIERSGDVSADHSRLRAVIEEQEAVGVVIGLPVDLRGQQAIAAQHALAEVQILATVVGVPVTTFDERMTTAAARKAQVARGVSSRRGRSSIDMEAAAVMLQGWIDSRGWLRP